MFSLSGQSPSEGESNVSLNSLVEFSILDDGSGLDLSSLIVDISGSRAIENLSFSEGFDGTFSSLNVEDFGLSIAIDKEALFEQGEVSLVKIQIKDLNNKYYNFNYTFKVVTAEPTLEVSSPEDGALVKSDQVIFFRFKDEIDDIDVGSVNILINDIPAISNGEIESSYSGQSSVVKKIENGVTVRIEPIESFRNGAYTVSYSLADLNQNKLSGKINYSVDLPQVILPSTFPQISFSGFSQGLKKVANIGDGNSLAIIWNKPISRSYKGDTFVIIYENESRLDIFDSPPKFIAKDEVISFTRSGLETGRQTFYAARGLEAFKNSIIISGMENIDEGVFSIPEQTTITSQVDESDTLISVESTDGYPSAGILIINSSEVIRYTAKTESSFILPSNGRGLNGTSRGIYISGDPIHMFFDCQDKNTVIGNSTPLFSDGYQSDREISGTGLVVTDYGDNDKKFFQGFDYCGYHQAIPQQVLQGKNDCGSYIGGEFNGLRGMNLFDRMLNREEVLLDQVGEPIILLKRLWDGQKCSCSDARRMHPKVKSCKKCYGTGYLGGYAQYNYRRRSDGRVMVMFGDTQEDLKLTSQAHLEQEYKPTCWTLPNPAIRDRDLIVRFDFNNDIEFIYEVLNISKNKLFYRHFTRQTLNLQRMDKTDIIYTVPYNRNF
jgi:hypothetical protein